MIVENKYFLNDKYIFNVNKKSLTDLDNSEDIIWLGSNESNILLAFIERPNQVLSRDEIHELVWTSNGFHVDESSVIQAISTVRKILKDSAKEPEFIKTIPKHGYQFIGNSKKIEEDVKQGIDDELQDDDLKEIEIERFNITNLLSKKLLSFFMVMLVSVLMFQFIWPLNLFSPKYSELKEIGRVGDIGVYLLNRDTNGASHAEDIKYCTNKLLTYHPNTENIDKVIVSYTFRNELIINVVDKYLTESVSYNLMPKNMDMMSFCEMRFDNDK
ncbi:winged helix-turn-helix domain-containing protein [Vibrio sp. DW001]|uniref:winged helix-turn-helix domain-containing protein n=1 Tax=Vibrio sp. DW001 TaxID=2912315 RepID=UPI0023B10B2C|nr:winged helix-turn-helix domain-containing protein [Vibrio sp. DW001]WED28668.1 winged helix-turn-helix domain-containing protein [Vibrio sp. DW001]